MSSSYPPQQPGYPPQPPGYTPQPPYAPQPQAVSPYAAPVQAGVPGAIGQAAKASGLAVASLVLGLISIIFFWLIFPVICAILAIIFGHVSLNQIKRSNGWLTGKGMAIAGLILGYLHIAFWIFWVVIFAKAGSSAP